MLFTSDVILAVFFAFALSAILTPVLIPLLRKLKAQQTEREDGVKSHLEKAGTPTMGGIVIIAAYLGAGALFAVRYPTTIPVLVLSLLFGIIGFVDDYLKVVKRKSDGLLPRQKMLCQIIVTTAFVIYLWIADSSLLELMLPFSGGYVLSGLWVKIIATPLAYLAIIGTVNGVNFTDGLDGLATSVTAVVSVFFIGVSTRLGGGISTAAGAMLGALLGFLLFNLHPAKVFMGDTGSLALGGFVAGCAYMLRMPVFILLFGLVYLVEVLSVIIQVTYFKKTGGKRIFKMAPIHHHFELCGWSETRVVGVFTIVTILLCLIACIHLL